MATENASITKPLVDIVVLGPPGLGKTALTAALTMLGNERGSSVGTSYDELARSAGKSLAIYESSSRRYRHLDFPGEAEAVAYMKASRRSVDGVILVCSAVDEPSAEAAASLKLARDAGVSAVIVFLNKADTQQAGSVRSPDATIRAMLSECGFPGKDVPFVLGSATRALDGDRSDIGVPAIVRLVDAMDDRIAIRERRRDLPFLFSVENVRSDPLRGTVMSGRILQGEVKLFDIVDAIGPPPPLGLDGNGATVLSIDRSGERVDQAGPGDYVDVRLRGLDRDTAKSAQALAQPRSARADIAFKGTVYVVRKLAAVDIRRPLHKWRVQIGCRWAGIVDIRLPPGLEFLEPGNAVDVAFVLESLLWTDESQPFAVLQNGAVVAYGALTK